MSGGIAELARLMIEAGAWDAVNLDGGASTGLRWRSLAGGPQTGPDSLPLPCAVLLTPAAAR